MNRSKRERIDFKVVRLPAWAAPIIAIAGFAILILGGLLGLGLLLLLVPVLLVAGIARRWGGPSVRNVDIGQGGGKEHKGSDLGKVIEGDYRVIDDPD